MYQKLHAVGFNEWGLTQNGANKVHWNPKRCTRLAEKEKESIVRKSGNQKQDGKRSEKANNLTVGQFKNVKRKEKDRENEEAWQKKECRWIADKEERNEKDE